MNKTALKNFATWSRRKLIEQVQTKALLYGIDEKNNLHIEEQFGQLLINGQTYPLSMKLAFTALQKQLEQKGYKQLLEEVAYTWFNRIIAIRYMEVHEYLPEKVNVLSSSVGRVDPDILFEYDTMDLAVKQGEVRELINTGNTEAAYRILFVAQCNALNRILPFMFEPIQDYTELLLPDFLLDAESVIKTLVQNEELTESFSEIEVIGWLYQYYIAEEKDRVFAQKSKYKKEEIPFATQLFTPKWIVQYMVQNSLGRYWTEAHREDEDLINNWEYFIQHEEEDFHEKIAPYVNKELKVEDIKLLDPAMGSGHILVYAFEVFHEIYEKCGYPERDIPRLILENNLYGLDIDDRAYQLAAFAVVMKAASYSKRFLRSVERKGIQLNLASIQETNHISDDVIAYIAQQEVGEQYNQVKSFFDQYHNAKTYGSLINIKEREISFIEERLNQVQNNPVEDLFYAEQHEIAKEVLPALIHQTKIMRYKFEIVVANPPYLGYKGMNKELSTFMNKEYPISKYDLSTAMMEKCIELTTSYIAMINIPTWMFITSYEKLRERILNQNSIINMLHLGRGIFGADFGSVSFVISKNANINSTGVYKRLFNSLGEVGSVEKKEQMFFEPNRTYKYKQKNFQSITGSPLAYWLDLDTRNAFLNKPLGEFCTTREGLASGDNDRFLRYWYEVPREKIAFKCEKNKYYPLMKGGDFRKWYGNLEYVINWEDEGYEIRNNKDENGRVRSHNYNLDYILKRGITWTRISSSDNVSFRIMEDGFLFDSAGASLFLNSHKENEVSLFYILGLMNSSVAKYLIPIINPTIALQVGSVAKIPMVVTNQQEVEKIVEELIKITKLDWDSRETSWDFKVHPLLEFKVTTTLKDAFEKWQNIKNEQYTAVVQLEQRLNEIFIDAYNLKQINKDTINVTLFHPNKIDDAKSLLTYFVGCLFGRFQCNDIIPTLRVVNFSEKEILENDIIKLLRAFLSTGFSPDTVDENILWIAEALQMKNGEVPEARIRRYFIDEFFTDHCKMYQKRPIYWLVDSGKQKGLRTLIYMHRYQPDTMATIRFEHLQEIQAKYQQEIADLENRLVNPNLSATDKKKLNAEKVLFEKKIDELREFDKRLAAIATEEIEIDLDDGVKVNYEKFYRGGKGVLAKIK